MISPLQVLPTGLHVLCLKTFFLFLSFIYQCEIYLVYSFLQCPLWTPLLPLRPFTVGSTLGDSRNYPRGRTLYLFSLEVVRCKSGIRGYWDRCPLRELRGTLTSSLEGLRYVIVTGSLPRVRPRVCKDFKVRRRRVVLKLSGRGGLT